VEPCLSFEMLFLLGLVRCQMFLVHLLEDIRPGVSYSEYKTTNFDSMNNYSCIISIEVILL